MQISNPRGPVVEADNGSGYGLRGLRERVESVRGTAQVDAADPHAFVLDVSLPLSSASGGDR